MSPKEGAANDVSKEFHVRTSTNKRVLQPDIELLVRLRDGVFFGIHVFVICDGDDWENVLNEGVED